MRGQGPNSIQMPRQAAPSHLFAEASGAKAEAAPVPGERRDFYGAPGADEPVDTMLPDGCAGIMAQFAAAMQEARRSAPRHQLAGILHALKNARRAALAMARRNAANERHGLKRKAMHAARCDLGLRRSGDSHGKAWTLV